MMKRLTVIVISSLLLTASSLFAEGLSFGISANNRVVGTQLGMLTSSPYGTLELGTGLTYNKNRYTIAHGLVSVKSDNLSPGLRYGLGFKYVMGSVRNKERSRRGDLSAMGFHFGVAYELPATINPLTIPIETTFDGTLAPESISFGESEGYADYVLGVRFYIIENAYVALTHTYIDAEFKTGGTSWSRYINETMVGVVLTF